MSLSRGEMAQIVFSPEELRNVDFALPREWVKAYAELHGENASIFYWVMDYNNPTKDRAQYSPFGRVVNMAERYVDMQMESIIKSNMQNLNGLNVSDLIKYLLIPHYIPSGTITSEDQHSWQNLDDQTIEWLSERHV